MKKKILFIEDDEIIRENTAEILEMANYEVLVADNGKLGIDRAKKEKVDLIICDIMMPEMDGYAVLYMLGKDPETSTIPFIFLSAKSEKSEVRKGMALGADDYITKPFEEMELLEAIEGRFKRNESLKRNFTKNVDGHNQFIEAARGLMGLEDLIVDNQIKKVKKKESIYFEGEFPNALFFLSKGKVKTYRVHEDVKEYITGIVGEGEYFGYLPIMERRAYDECAVALEDTELFKISKKDFMDLLEKNRDVSAKFIKMISNNLIDREKKLLSLAYDSVRKRTANALIELGKDLEEGKESIDVLRADLASMVGTASESVIRTLSDFKQENLIEMRGKEIVIKNLKGLQSIW